MKFKSKAVWPEGTNIGVSEDEHDTREQAQAVCDMLKRDGLGGEGTIFPISTEVVEVHDLETLLKERDAARAHTSALQKRLNESGIIQHKRQSEIQRLQVELFQVRKELDEVRLQAQDYESRLASSETGRRILVDDLTICMRIDGFMEAKTNVGHLEYLTDLVNDYKALQTENLSLRELVPTTAQAMVYWSLLKKYKQVCTVSDELAAELRDECLGEHGYVKPSKALVNHASLPHLQKKKAKE